jgi:hypothetical protein
MVSIVFGLSPRDFAEPPPWRVQYGQLSLTGGAQAGDLSFTGSAQSGILTKEAS